MGCKDKYISDLESEIQYLKKLLDENGINYDYDAHLRALQSDVGDIVARRKIPVVLALWPSPAQSRRSEAF